MAEPSADAPITDEERAAARRVVLQVAGALVLALLAAAVVLVVHHHGSGATSSGPVQTDASDAIGPLPGEAVPDYLANRATSLANVKVNSTRAAAVSFAGYMAPADARRLLESFDVRALLVAAPAGDPEVVHGDLGQWAVKERADAGSQRAQFEDLLMSTSDPSFVAEYKAEAARLTHLAQTAAPDGPIVFGAVVVADGPSLRRLAATSGVRLVDVAATAHVPNDDQITALRPEETTQAGNPPTRPY